jgi:lycopene beta-cyclase
LCKQLLKGDAAAVPRFLQEHRLQATFALHLNRLLFTCFAETDMWGVLARFYRLPEPLIERFYALSSSTADRLRIVGGWPPRGFSLARALSAALGAA